LADVPFGDIDAFRDFLFQNSRAHHDVATKLEQLGHSIDSYPLTEIGDVADWMATHDSVHQEEFALLGLTGLPSMAEFDLTIEKEYNDFMYLHAAAHVAVNNALGIF
jgi:hypothetical protein